MVGLPQIEFNIITILFYEGPKTIWSLAKQLGTQESLVRYHVNKLLDLGVLVGISEDKKTLYNVSRDRVHESGDFLVVRIDGDVFVYVRVGSETDRLLPQMP